MPIPEFNKWAYDYCKKYVWVDHLTQGSQPLTTLFDLLFKAYELGRNPNVEKLDK